MRIAEVAPHGLHPISGVTSVVARLSIQLRRLGHHVELWMLSPWDHGRLASWLQRVEQAGVVTVDARMELGFDPGDRSVDVAHLHNVFNVQNTRLSRRLDQPYVITTHGGYAPEQLAFHRVRKTLYKHLAEARLLRGANRLVALTDVERQEIEEFCGVRATVIPNGVDKPPPLVDGTSVRGTLGIGSSLLAVYAGRIDLYHKRLDELVRALADAPRWQVLIMGGDFRGGRRHLEQLSQEIGVTERLHIWEPQEGAGYYEALAAADVFALISRWEGQSVALLEALSLGLPAIVSAEVERRTPIAARGAGWVANPSDVGNILNVAGSALDEGTSYRRSAKLIAEDYTWSRAAEAYERVFRAATDRSG